MLTVLRRLPRCAPEIVRHGAHGASDLSGGRTFSFHSHRPAARRRRRCPSLMRHAVDISRTLRLRTLRNDWLKHRGHVAEPRPPILRDRLASSVISAIEAGDAGPLEPEPRKIPPSSVGTTF